MSGEIPPKSRPQASRQSQQRNQKPARATADRTAPSISKDPLAQQQPLVGGRWLLYAIPGVVALAAVCTYLTLCLLFYQGQWQIVFHPVRSITATPATVGLKYDAINFDY